MAAKKINGFEITTKDELLARGMQDIEEAAEEGLPPAGYEQDEALRVRADELEEAAELLSEESGAETIPEKAFEPDREIQHVFSSGAHHVSDALPEYEYSWVCTAMNGTDVIAKKSLQCRLNGRTFFIGWELVDSGHPEARECIDVNGHRRIGDVVLMRRRKEFGELQRQAEIAFNAQRTGEEMGSVRDVENHLRRRGIDGIKVLDTDSEDIAAMQKRAGGSNAFARNMFARNVAIQKVDDLLRKGAVPGIPLR